MTSGRAGGHRTGIRMSIQPATDTYRIVELATVTPDRASFAPYGQLILPSEDGTPFGPDDAVLDFSRGTPRFYIMRLHHRSMVVTQITRHARVTQCLAAAGTYPWFIALAPAGAGDEPDLAAIRGFRIPPGVAIKLHPGTWHAGPFFVPASMNFFNLELADTNETDHHNAYLADRNGVAFRLLTDA